MKLARICRHVEAGNRLSQSALRCPGCGYATNADPNAIDREDAKKSKAGYPTIIMVRHGNTALNTPPEKFRGWDDVPLDAKGRADAKATAKKISQNYRVDKIYSSDLSRAMDTAKQIGAAVGGVAAKATRGLRPWDLGKFTGKPTKESWPLIEPYVKNPKRSVPGNGDFKGEAFDTFIGRINMTLDHLCEEAKKDNITIVGVTHTRDIRATMDHVEEAGDKYMLAKEDPCPPGGFLVFVFKDNKWQQDDGVRTPESKAGGGLTGDLRASANRTGGDIATGKRVCKTMASQVIYKGRGPCAVCGHAENVHTVIGCNGCDPTGTKVVSRDLPFHHFREASEVATSNARDNSGPAWRAPTGAPGSAARRSSQAKIVFDLHDRFHGTGITRPGGVSGIDASTFGKSGRASSDRSFGQRSGRVSSNLALAS